VSYLYSRVNRSENVFTFQEANKVRAWVEQLGSMIQSKVSITITPKWAGLIDFQTRFPRVAKTKFRHRNLILSTPLTGLSVRSVLGFLAPIRL
jgi:hypothetical protein